MTRHLECGSIVDDPRNFGYTAKLNELLDEPNSTLLKRHVE